MSDPSDTPELSKQDSERLEQLFEMLERETHHFAGYPCNADFDYSPLFRFLDYPVNNVGDPYLKSNYHLNTHEMECEVLEVIRELVHAPEEDFWGYVTNGGTEGNMYGIFLARELYPEGIVYYSEDTHYSVNKVLRMLHIRNVMIRSNPDGSIDLDDLRESINIHRDAPVIVFANAGTTMKGAVDDLEGINQIFNDLAIHSHYVHVDAALSGMILPFVEDPQPFDFREEINSMSISGHKMIGCPIPCGFALARKNLVDRISQSVEYIGTMDTTVTGSRNAITPLFLWYRFRTVGVEGFRQRIARCQEVAEYTVDELKKLGLDAWRHRNSVTVVFPRPSMDFISRWQLAVHHDIAHIITMPHISTEMIDRIISDLKIDLEKTARNKESQ